MLKSQLLIALRSFLKNRIYLLFNVIGMAIAIGYSIVTYFVYEHDARFDAMHLNGNRVYRVGSIRLFDGQTKEFGYVPLPLGAEIQANLPGVAHVVRFAPSYSNFKVGDDLFASRMAYVDSSFFKTFSFDILTGDPAALRDKSNLFISDVMAKRLFGTLSVLGKTVVQVNGTKLADKVVAGVYKEPAQNSSFYGPESFSGFDNHADEFGEKDDDWKSSATLFIALVPGTSVAETEKALQVYTDNNNKAREDFVIQKFVLDPFATMAHTDRAMDIEHWTWSAPPISAIVGSIVTAILILLLACFNLTNTAIAISNRRLKEIGIRKVMGSRKGQLVTQFLLETIGICLVSLVVGLFFSRLITVAWNEMWGYMKINPDYTGHPGIFVFLAVVVLLTGLIAGSYPAFYVSHFEPVAILKNKLRHFGTNIFTRVLLCLQFAISLLGIVSSVAFLENARYQRDYDLGFNVKGSIVAYVDGKSEFDTYRNALASNPDINYVAGSRNSLFSYTYDGPAKSEGRQLHVDAMDVGDDYLKAMQLKLIAGRDFVPRSEEDIRHSVIITENMARAFGWSDPIGQQFLWMDSVRLNVVGVIKNVYTQGLWHQMGPMIIRYCRPEDYTHFIVSAPSNKLADVNTFMQAKWKEVFPNRLYNGRMLTSSIDEVEEVNNNIVKMFGFIGTVCILLSLSGLFSMVSLNIIKRTKEIGVRKVLGASVANITRIISSEFVLIMIIACTLGAFGSIKLINLLMNSIWDYYQPVTITAVISSVLLLFLMGALTVGLKMRQAATTNPVDTLRDE